jgi:3-keto-5-aminohexanoate cleavage enzyme
LAHARRALVLGGNIRTGLEDHLYLPSGEMAKSNGEMVEVARADDARRGPAPGDGEEARRILSLPEPS